MGLLGKVFEKYAESTAKRDDACAEVDSFISKTLNALNGSNEFIGIEWALKIKNDCKVMLEKINGISLLAFIPASKLNSRKTEIEKLSNEIEYKVNAHNDKMAYL